MSRLSSLFTAIPVLQDTQEVQMFFFYSEVCCQPHSIQVRVSQYLHIFYILASDPTNQGQNAVLAEPRGSPVVH